MLIVDFPGDAGSDVEGDGTAVEGELQVVRYRPGVREALVADDHAFEKGEAAEWRAFAAEGDEPVVFLCVGVAEAVDPGVPAVEEEKVL